MEAGMGIPQELGYDQVVGLGTGMARVSVAEQRAVSRGVKLLLIALLALGMSLLAQFVESMTTDRSANAERAHKEVSARVIGGYVALVPTYRSVERSLKYAPLFLGLVFLSYFLFEVTSRRPMHLAQYVLVGVAQLIFYLLLLSFAERIGFDWGFLLGGTPTVVLLSVNAGWVFEGGASAMAGVVDLWSAVCVDLQPSADGGQRPADRVGDELRRHCGGDVLDEAAGLVRRRGVHGWAATQWHGWNAGACCRGGRMSRGKLDRLETLLECRNHLPLTRFGAEITAVPATGLTRSGETASRPAGGGEGLKIAADQTGAAVYAATPPVPA